MMSGNVQYSLPDGQMSLHISDALVANSASSDLTTHVKDDPAVKLGRSSDDYHLKTRSKTSVFNCDVCERTFESAEFLSSHVLSHSLDIGAYSCEICHKVFNEKHDLAQHKCLQNTDMHSQNLIQDNNNAFHPQTNVPRGDINGPYGCVSGMGNDGGGGSGGHGMDGEYIGLNSQKGMQLFACEYCEKKFKTNSALLIHRRSHTGETPYPCEFCGKSFRQSAHLDVHMRIHTGEMPYKCAYCDKSFTQKNNRNRHQLLHLNPNGQESNLAGSTKPHNEHCLDTPTAPSIGNMPTEPPRHFSYDNTSSMTQPPPQPPPPPPPPPQAQIGGNYSQPHHLTGSTPFTYQCNVCQKVYSNNYALTQHMQIHNKDQSFDCYVCNHKFKQRAHLETHLRVHTHEMPFKCQYCDKCFSQKGNKNRHERLHLLNDTADPPSSGTLIPPVSSSHTNSTSLSSTPVAMETPMNSAKSCIQQPNIYIDSEFASCDICHKQFFSKDDLHAHRNTHHLSGGDPSSMNNAMNMESPHPQMNPGQYGSSYCNISSDKSYQPRESPQAQFSPNKPLGMYPNSAGPPGNNMGNKMYYDGGGGNVAMPEHLRQDNPDCCNMNMSNLSPCEVCGKEISCQQEMIQHAQCHKGVFNCEYCPKEFRSNSALLVHRRVHTGETPYKCDFCDRGFKQAPHLDVHLRTHTGEMPFQCLYCDKKFTQNSNKNRHQRTHFFGDAASGFNSPNAMNPGMPVNPENNENMYTNNLKCELCGCVFAERNSFVDHMLSHQSSSSGGNVGVMPDNQKPSTLTHGLTHLYQCTYCNAGFSCQPSLDNHIAMTHNGKMGVLPNNNSDCGMQFGHQQQPPENSNHMKNNQRRPMDYGNMPHYGNPPEMGNNGPPGDSNNYMHSQHTNFYDMGNNGMAGGGGGSNSGGGEASMSSGPEVYGGYGSNREPVVNMDCEFCHKNFKSMSSLMIHRRIHTGEAPFECSFCHRAFKQNVHLEVHMRTHTGETPFKCEFCDKRFTQKSNRDRHQRTHLVDAVSLQNSEMDYPMQNVEGKDAASADQNSNTEHYNCDVCSSVFTNRDDFTDHRSCHDIPRLTEDSRRPYNRRKYDNVNVNPNESRAAGGEGVFKCDLCGCYFSNVSDLRHHQNTQHSQDSYFQRDNLRNGTNSNSSQYPVNVDSYNYQPEPKRYCSERNYPHHGSGYQDRDMNPMSGQMLPPNMSYQGRNESGYMRPEENSFCEMGNNYCNSQKRPSGPPPPQMPSHHGDMVSAPPMGKGDNETQHICNFCQKTFRSMSALIVHQRIHTGETPFQCDYCQKCFRQNAHLDVHLRTHTKETPFKCEFCDKQFTQNCNRNRHQRTHSGDAASSQGQGDTHSNNVSGGNASYSCDVCPLKFTNRDDFTDHRSCHDIPKLNEESANQTIATRRGRRRTTIKSYVEIDDDDFDNEDDMPVSETSYGCSQCDEKCMATNDRQRHMNHNVKNDHGRFQPPNSKVYRDNQKCTNYSQGCHQCEICSQKFFGEEELCQHRLSHMNNPYGGQIGGSYPSHPNTPTTTKHSDICMMDVDKDSGNCGNMNRKYVTGNNCELCCKTFSSTSALTTHMRVHTGESPYKCDFCHRAFKQTAHLDVHMRVHTGETPFKCHYCDKRFTQKNNMLRHEKIHHGDGASQSSSMPHDTSVDNHCQTCQAQCQSRSNFSDPHQMECPGTPDSVSDCDICCKESNVKADICPYSDPRHNRNNSIVKSPKDNKISMGNFDNKKDRMMKKYDCCQDSSCPDAFHNNTDMKNKSSHFAMSPDQGPTQDFPTTPDPGPMESTVLQLPYACRHCKIEFLNQDDLCDHEPQCEAANFVPPGTSGKFPPLDHTTEGEAVYLDDNQMLNPGHRCEFCQKVFKSFSSLSVHRRVHTGEAPFQCHFCQRRFKQNSHLEVHLRTHTDETPYKCEFCDKCFTQAGNRNRHQRTHFMEAVSLGPAEFNRLEQEDIENNPGDSSEHFQSREYQENDSRTEIPNLAENDDDDAGYDDGNNNNGDGSKKDVDIPLPKTQKRKRGRPKGSRSYFKIERQPSPESVKMELAEDVAALDDGPDDASGRPRTRSHSRLKNSRKMSSTNDTEKNFPCDICSLGFSSAEALSHHQLSVHEVLESGNKNDKDGLENLQSLSCEYCDKTFTNGSALSVHRRVHTGEAPFQCQYCHKSFKQNAHLDVHMRIHTGETPFQCAFCDKRFSQNCNRLRHQKTHFTNVTSGENGVVAAFNPDTNTDTATTVSTFKCDLCNQEFNTKHTFDNHVCVDHSYDDDVRPLLPSPDLQTSSDDIKSIPNKDPMELKESWSETLTNDGFDKISDDLLSAATSSEPDFPTSNKLIKEEKSSPQKEFCEIKSNAHQFQSANDDGGESLGDENRTDNDDALSEKQDISDSAKYGNFVCDFCPSRSFHTQAALLTHRRTHTGEAPYQCTYCSKSFKQVAHLDTHLRVHTGEKPYKCKYCKKSFTQKSNRNRHEQVHELSGKTRPPKGSVPEYRCELCDGYFANATDLDMHRCTMTAADEWSSHAGDTDISADSQNLPYTCNICGKEYSSRVRFEKHRQTHEHGRKEENMSPLMERNGQSGSSSGTDQLTFFCEVCRQKFTDKTEYTDHIFMHISENPYQQNQGMTHKNSKDVHVDQIHEVCYVCEHCQNEFYNKNDFHNHRCFKNMPNGKGPMNKVGSQNSENIDDVTFNSGEYGLGTAQSEDFPEGVQGLCSNNFFECEFCDKTFRNHSTMLIHRRVHTGEMPFKCKFCERCFKQNAHLEVHLRTHTGETPFHCRFCEKSFTQKSNRNRHERTHLVDAETDGENQSGTNGGGGGATAAGMMSFDGHGENLHCHLCSVDFSTEDDLKEHLETQHPDDMESVGSGFQPMGGSGGGGGSYLTTLKEEHEIYEREALSRNSYPTSLGNDRSLPPPYAENPSMDNFCDMELGMEDEQLVDNKQEASSGQQQLYDCEFCHKQLKSLSSLIVHRRVHTGEAPFKCKYCERCFKQSAHLEVHMRTHTGETPYKCDFCDKSFTQNSNRLRHQRLHFMDTTSIGDDNSGHTTTDLSNDGGNKDQNDAPADTSHLCL